MAGLGAFLDMYTVLGAAALYLAYIIYWEFTTGASRRKLIAEKGCEPPVKWPTKDPILGYDFFTATKRALKEHKLLQTNQGRFEKLGRTTYAAKMLGRSFVVTTEPENLKHVQSLDFKNWSLGTLRIDAMGMLLGRGIFTTDGQAWAHSREMLRPNFVRAQVSDLATFETHVGHLIDAIPTDGSTINLSPLFFRLTIDSATEFLFGESTNCLAPGLNTVSAQAFADSFDRGQIGAGNRSRRGIFSKIIPDKQFKKDCDYCQGFIDDIVNRAFANRAEILAEKGRNPSSRYVFLHQLMTQTDDKVQIRSELLNILLAGRDTTASLLTNLWHTLSRRPDIWAALSTEVAALNGEAPTYEQIKEMKYLRAVINESLRLYPQVPGNGREAVNDTYIPVGGGKDGKSPVFIPKGSSVSWSLYTMHRRKDFYGPDAEEFKPERWLGEKGLRPGWEFLPFNGGPRVCIGQQFALTEASYTTIRLMQTFPVIEARDDKPWQEYLHLTCVNLNGAVVGLKRR